MDTKSSTAPDAARVSNAATRVAAGSSSCSKAKSAHASRTYFGVTLDLGPVFLLEFVEKVESGQAAVQGLDRIVGERSQHNGTIGNSNVKLSSGLQAQGI